MSFVHRCYGALLAFPLVAGFSPVSASSSQGAVPQLHRAPLMDQFEAAAAEFGVPVELLISVSFNAGQWYPDTISQKGDGTGEAGHMGLRTYPGGPSAALAAQLLGVDVQTVLRDSASNIRGGAAILARFAANTNGGRAVSAELTHTTARAWWEAVATYAGVDSEYHADLFAKGVFHAVETGLEGVSRQGDWILTEAQPLPRLISEWSTEADQAWIRAQEQAQKTNATDYPGAVSAPACSSNYTNSSRTAADISYVIIHVAQGSYSGTVNWFQNCSASVSAHYVVSKGGAITQSVREEDIAWHAGNWDYNEASVGIEHEGYIDDPNNFTEAMYSASAALTKSICDRNGIPKTRTYIIGHNEVPGCSYSGGGGSGCHTDPGPYFNWSYYISLVNGGTSSDPTGDLIGVVAEGDIYNGPRIAGATVTLNTGDSVTSSSSGIYEFVAIDVGTYTITASAPGYQSASKTCSMQANVDNWCSIALTKGADPTPIPTEEPTPTPVPSGGCKAPVHTGLLPASTADNTLPFTALAIFMGLMFHLGSRRRP